MTHHVSQLALDLVRGESLAEGGLPQQHVTVVGQQLGTLRLRLGLHHATLCAYKFVMNKI